MPPSDNTPTMILPATFYDMLDPEYREKLLQLENTFKLVEKEESNIEECFDFIAEFLFQFMIPKEFWDKLFEFGCDERYRISWHVKKVFAPSVYQFYCKKYDFVDMIIYDNQKKIYESDYYLTFDVEIFLYPQKDLGKKMDDYEKYGVYSFIPKSIIQTIEKMTALYSRIKSNEKNVDKWFEALTEVEDEEFVENNIEYRIGNDLTNKELWKLYIEYLKNKDDKKQKLLQTYSKYCRFFLDDSEMLKEYKKAAGNQIVYVPWKNPFNFEIFDETYFDKIEYKKTEHEITQKSPLTCYFNAENASIQRFPFKPNFMNYILKNANAYILHILFKSCKWFYLKNPVTICYKIDVRSCVRNVEINEQCITLKTAVLNQTNINKLYISTCAFFDTSFIQEDLSRFIPKLYRFSAKYISLEYKKLSEKELEFLIGHGNVEDLRLWEIKDSNGDYFVLENILKMLPKIKKFYIHSFHCTFDTSKILCELPFKNKISNFDLIDIKNHVLEPKEFAGFVNKHFLCENEIFRVQFSNLDENEDLIAKFKETMDSFLEEKWTTKYDYDNILIKKK